MSKETNRINYLDGLRGFASLGVYFYHFVSAFLPYMYFKDVSIIHLRIEKYLANTPIFIFIDGPLMVYIFFILSGFVLTKIAYEKVTSDKLVLFWLKRYLRLGIPVLFSILLGYLLLSGGFAYNKEASLISKSIWLGNFYSFTPNLSESIFQGVIGAIALNQNTYNPLLWTIYYEFIGSLFILGFVTLLRKYSLLKTILTVVLGLLLINTPIFTFILGMIVYECIFIYKRYVSKIVKMILFVTTYLIWDFTSNGIITRNFSRTNYGALEILEVKYILLALVSLGVLILVNSSNFIQNILNSRMFQFLGKISYSLYLVHLILLVTFGSKIFLFFNSVFSYSYLLTILFTLVFITALTITVSFAFCKLVDEYGIKLSNGVYKVLEKL